MGELQEVSDLLRQMASALDYAHSFSGPWTILPVSRHLRLAISSVQPQSGADEGTE